MPLRLNRGRIEDHAERRLRLDELVEVCREFLATRFGVMSRRFGRDRAHQPFEHTSRQLAPELQEVARRYGLDKPRAVGGAGAPAARGDGPADGPASWP